jgi:hypothetical protein
MESTRRKQIDATITIASCDRAIERILNENNDELQVFVQSMARGGHFRHVVMLVKYERLRRLSLIDQLESSHTECEEINVEKVVTWAWAGVMILGLLIVVFAAIGIVQAAVGYLINLF